MKFLKFHTAFLALAVALVGLGFLMCGTAWRFRERTGFTVRLCRLM